MDGRCIFSPSLREVVHGPPAWPPACTCETNEYCEWRFLCGICGGRAPRSSSSSRADDDDFNEDAPALTRARHRRHRRRRQGRSRAAARAARAGSHLVPAGQGEPAHWQKAVPTRPLWRRRSRNHHETCTLSTNSSARLQFVNMRRKRVCT